MNIYQVFTMQTIEVSDTVYQKLLSRRLEGESLSNVILRQLDNENEDEVWDVKKLDEDTEKVLQSSSRFCDLDEALQ